MLEKTNRSILLTAQCEINSSIIFSELSTIPEAEPFSSDHKSYIHFSSIPAFTIDEQIYSRCPTVVVATVGSSLG